MKYAFIKQHRDAHPVANLCRVLSVSRSAYYRWAASKPSARDRFNKAVVSEMRAIHSETMKTYGSPRMTVELQERGYAVAHGRVERLMSHHGIAAQQTKRHRRTWRHREPQQPKPNILNREFSANGPNEKWVSDITFIETRKGWLYLAIVLDLYSRVIVGWSMSRRIDGDLVKEALNMAIQARGNVAGTLVHSDQGSQYTASGYQSILADHEMVSSMSRKGECHDNAVAESFFHSLKSELVYQSDFNSHEEAKQAIFKYIELFYNRKRRHSYLNYQAPLKYESMMAAA